MNCLQNVDTESMSLILTGLARCGAWGCFDEFNRLQEATLSSISMLIQPIQSALKERSGSVQIGERQVSRMSYVMEWRWKLVDPGIKNCLHWFLVPMMSFEVAMIDTSTL